MTDILKDLVVVELASVLAGPLAGSFLAEHGARVIKIENKKSGGDVTRQWKLGNEDPDAAISAYYSSANFGKEVISLDLLARNDYAQLVTLLKKADIVISNFQKKTALKLKVDYDSVFRVMPNIIYAQLVAYTWDDPKPGYDLVMQAEAGFISMNGSEDGSADGNLAKMPVALIDVIAGHQIKEAILLSLLTRYKTGNGSYSEISLYKSAISGLANQASNYLMSGHIPKPIGTLHPNIAPYGDVVVTNDKKMVILAIGSDKQFEKLGKTLKLASELLHTFRLNKERVSRRDELMLHIRSKIEVLSYDSLRMRFQNANIPYCSIAHLDEVFENPLAKEMIIEETIADQKTVKVSNTAFTIEMSK